MSLGHMFALLGPARYQLFSTIVLQTVQRTESFGEFLDMHPWAGPLVRKLVHSAYVPISSGPTATMLDVVPLHLLSRLPNLRTWEIGMAGIGRRSEAGAWLSCRRSALSSYQTYSNVRNLELDYVLLEDIYDFIGLASTFTRIHTLACSHITVKSSTEIGHQITVHGPETDVDDRPVHLRSLRVSTTVDVRVVGYLLDSSRTTLKSFALTFESYQSDQFFERLGASVRLLSQLSSLKFVLPSTTISWDIGREFWHNISHTTRIVESVKSAMAQEMRVEVKPDPIASLGCCLSSDPRALEACRALEDALLAFPRPQVLFHDTLSLRRAGRWEFWSATIKRAFPRLSEVERLTFPDLKSNTSNPVGHEATVKCLVTSFHGQCFVTASDDGTVIIWDAERGTVSQEWFAHQRGVRALALSPDSRLLISAGERDETLTIWDISNNICKPTVAAVLEGHTKAVTACTWSPDGALIASASADGTVRVWDARTFEQRDLLLDDPGQQGSGFHPLRFSPDSRLLAWTSLPSQMLSYGCTIWSPLTGEQPKRFPSPSINMDSGVRIKALAFDPDGVRIATAHTHGRVHNENVVRVWDIATGAILAELAGHEMMLTDVSFSPDGRSVLSASCDGSARIWDVEDGRETVSLTVGEWSIPKACFSPDGKYIATASWEGIVHLWRTGDGSLAAVFSEHGAAVVHVAFSLDGEYLVSGDYYGAVYIRRLSMFSGN